MIAKEDCIVSVSYPSRGIVSREERTETVSLVGSPEDIAATLSKQIESWLKRGASRPMTIHATDRFSIIDAAEAAKR